MKAKMEEMEVAIMKLLTELATVNVGDETAGS